MNMLDNSQIDVRRLVADIHTHSRQIVTLKRLLRTRWSEPMGAQQQELCALKRRVTGLCVLRAWMRGRMHLTDAPHDDGVAACVWGIRPWQPEAYAARVVERISLAYAIVPALDGDPGGNATAAEPLREAAS